MMTCKNIIEVCVFRGANNYITKGYEKAPRLGEAIVTIDRFWIFYTPLDLVWQTLLWKCSLHMKEG